jgi:large subunit ribosomal protein L37Ae
MKKKKSMGPAKRFGARYGRRVKEKLAAIEKVQRADHKCPYCHYLKVKRISAGIWHCKNCEAKFTGKAYTISKKRSSKVFEEESPEVSEEESPEVSEEDDEVLEDEADEDLEEIENIVPEINKEVGEEDSTSEVDKVNEEASAFEVDEINEGASAPEEEKTGTEEA